MNYLKFTLANYRSLYLLTILLAGMLLSSCEKDNPEGEELVESRFVFDNLNTKVVDALIINQGPVGNSTNQIVTEIFNEKGDVLAFYMTSFTSTLPLGEFEYQRNMNIDFDAEGPNGGLITWDNKQYIPVNYDLNIFQRAANGVNEIGIIGNVVLVTEALAGNFDNKIGFSAVVGFK